VCICINKSELEIAPNLRQWLVQESQSGVWWMRMQLLC
jgi:hypothetical protein